MHRAISSGRFLFVLTLAVGLLAAMVWVPSLTVSQAAEGYSLFVPYVEQAPTPTPTPVPNPGTTTRVSVSSTGGQANGLSNVDAITPDGRFLLFTSEADNLVPGDTNGKQDTYVRDLWTGQTERVSLADNGDQGNGSSWGSGISSDGRYVAFTSSASNLVPGDDNNNCLPNQASYGDYVNCPDVFLRDRQSRRTFLISRAPDGGPGNSHSYSSFLSPDSRYIGFYSRAENLVPGDTNWTNDAFLFDRVTNQVERVSVASDGAESYGYSFADGVSADGRYALFTSTASNLVPGDTNGQTDVFIRDRQARETKRVSVALDGSQGNGESWGWAISADGRFALISSRASNLVAGDTNGAADVLVLDIQTREVTPISVSSGGDQGQANSGDVRVQWSPDGRYVVFDSSASNLVPGDNNAMTDIFLRDRAKAQTFIVSIATNGTQGNGASDNAVVSADGKTVAFTSRASNLVEGDTNGVWDVFVRQRQ